MPLTFERKLPIILFFVFLMLTTIGVVFYQNTTSMQDAITLQKHTQEVIGKVDETVALAFEIQSSFSTFMLVSNNTYLDPLERAKPKIRQNIEQLRALTANKADQLDDVNRVDQTLKEYISEVSRKIDRRKMEGATVAESELLWPQGKTMLDQIRFSGERIKSIEVKERSQNDLYGDRIFSITVWVLIISSIAGIVALGVANLTVVSEAKKRKAAQSKLIEVNEGLERNVEQRTMELKRANEKLLEVGLERESILFSEKQARMEAEIANRLRDEFMATVSHELRTPLNSILGWARLMKGGSLDDAQSEKALTTIIKNSESQNRLIEDLLDVARVISGKLQLEIAEQDPVEIISQAIETVRPAAEARHIRTEFTAETHGARAVVDGDHNRLVQVFTNLLGNAVKFSPDHSVIYVSLEIAPDSLSASVRDEGKGISPEFLPLVFERFRQDVTNKSNNGGLGLGLAIVRNLVEMHHGTVKAESEGENKGSTFTVTLPARSDRSSDNDILEL
jgi:signal transduction histidine kinase